MAEWLGARGLAPAATPGRDGRIRVGSCSRTCATIRSGTPSSKAGFNSIDRERFPMYAFHLGKGDEAARARLRAPPISAPDPKELARVGGRRLRQRPDVLIYPEIGMDPTALKLASLRLAPVQIAAWGHPRNNQAAGPSTTTCLHENLEPPGAHKRTTRRSWWRVPSLGCFRTRTMTEIVRGFAKFGLDADRPLLVCPRCRSVCAAARLDLSGDGASPRKLPVRVLRPSHARAHRTGCAHGCSSPSPPGGWRLSALSSLCPGLQGGIPRPLCLRHTSTSTPSVFRLQRTALQAVQGRTAVDRARKAAS